MWTTQVMWILGSERGHHVLEHSAKQSWQSQANVLGVDVAGCPAAVANLWDVTDRDIDRFALALLQRWAPVQDAAGSSRQHEGSADNAHARQGECIARSVALSRAACRLPHLIGAAPVCYGIPTSVRPALLPHCSDP